MFVSLYAVTVELQTSLEVNIAGSITGGFEKTRAKSCQEKNLPIMFFFEDFETDLFARGTHRQAPKLDKMGQSCRSREAIPYNNTGGIACPVPDENYNPGR